MPDRKFVLNVDSSEVEALHRRIDSTRWPSGAREDWREGTDYGYLQELLHLWRDEFSWQAQAAALNKVDQVLVDVPGGISLHVLHQRGVGPAPMPLILTHGWPSSFVEWRHVIGPLSDPGAHGGDPADAFHVIAPSLPGFGYSTPGDQHHTVQDTARVWVDLMDRFGYRRFAAHGTDWGSLVTAHLGALFPERLIGIHMGALHLSPAADSGEPDPTNGFDQRTALWRGAEYGYAAIQATKPQSLAFGLADSPAGLAAWIAEKWRTWTDCGGDPSSAIDVTDLLTTISLYWYTRTIGTASRIYAVNGPTSLTLPHDHPVRPPAGFLFQKSLGKDDPRGFLDVQRPGAPPRSRAEGVFDVRRWTVLERGGHFPALETPIEFVDEIRSFFRSLRR
jgi:pimeloyl-ACP methyl ester carboxylesterase